MQGPKRVCCSYGCALVGCILCKTHVQHDVPHDVLTCGSTSYSADTQCCEVVVFGKVCLVACASRLLSVIQARNLWMCYLILFQIQIERYDCDLIENQICQRDFFFHCELGLFEKISTEDWLHEDHV